MRSGLHQSFSGQDAGEEVEVYTAACPSVEIKRLLGSKEKIVETDSLDLNSSAGFGKVCPCSLDLNSSVGFGKVCPCSLHR